MKIKLQSITQKLSNRVLEIVDAGLVSGLGEPVPGKLCVEAAVCYALGEPHGDTPSCVGAAVRAAEIGLNDSCWSSNAVRAAGMRRLAVAQLGSISLNQVDFARRLAISTVRTMLPPALRAIGLTTEAAVCEGAENLSHASAAAAYASAAAYTADAASASASAAAAAARCSGCVASYALRSSTINAALLRFAALIESILTEMDCEGCKFLPS